MASSSQHRVGLYAWGGPGTIRLIQTKYHSPTIDLASFLSIYDLSYLSRAKELFGVTDMWVSYSWGFSNEREQIDREFLRARLSNFQQLGIKTHAYVQGLNVVTKEFETLDPFCRDPHGHLLPYSKGRSFTCPNNPRATALILDRVRDACQEDVDGVYIDNILFGLPPIYFRQDFSSFFGCACIYCQTAFAEWYGYPLPLAQKTAEQLADFVSFRVRSTRKLLIAAHTIAKSFQKQFGINLYDPYQHNPKIFYGYDLRQIDHLLDYHLIENHALPRRGVNNTHLRRFIQESEKPTFIVSYHKGIGYEPAYTQMQINAIITESKILGYAPCLKVTEFTTKGTWHTLDLSKLTKPKPLLLPLPIINRSKTLEKSRLPKRQVAKVLQRHYARALSLFVEHPRASALLATSGIYQHKIQSWKSFEY